MRATTGSVDVGVMALEGSERVDFDRLRDERRARCLAAMAANDLDVLVLGREGNGRYVSGARRLWTAGTRPFAPATVLVRETQEVFLMSTWDDGIPDDIALDHLYALSWNPMSFVDALTRAGVGSARRVGIDGMSPMFRALLPMAMPSAAFVDAQSVMREVRMCKTSDEIQCLRTAVAITEAGLCAADDALVPGIRERELLGAFVERVSGFGCTAPATEGPFCVVRHGSDGATATLRHFPTHTPIAAGALVAMASGALYAGYEGAVGRTRVCGRPSTDGEEALLDRWSGLFDAVLEQCRAGSTGLDLRRAYEASGTALPGFPIAYSIGIGHEVPVAGSRLGVAFDEQWVLKPSMVLAIQGWVVGDAGGYLGVETVLITDGEPEVLSTLRHDLSPSS